VPISLFAAMTETLLVIHVLSAVAWLGGGSAH
jgi:uncharacterized membrane protein